MKNELRARILEMTLAAFGASACATTQATDPAKVPSAAEVTPENPASHGEASCSAAGCGAKADDTAPADTKSTDAKSAPATDAKDVAGASAIATPASATPQAAVDADPSKPAEAATDAPKPAHVKGKPGASKRPAKKKSADDDGCGAGSCASAK